MSRHWTEPIPFKDRIDKITLTGKTVKGETVSLTLLPEELAYLQASRRDKVEGLTRKFGCTHLEAVHGGDDQRWCEIEGCEC